MRNARQYTKRVRIYQQVETPDGFGGVTLAGTHIGTSWARVRTIPTQKLLEYGLNETQSSARFFMRHRNDIDFNREDIYLVYQGKTYEINRVTETDLRGIEFEILAQAVSTG